jgi:hypothetical protein
MRKLLVLSLFVFFSMGSYCQRPVADINTYLYNNIYKNIAAYNIKYSYYPLNGSVKQDIFRSNGDFFYDAFLPDFGYKLDMKIIKLDWQYPDKNFNLYKIFVNGFRYTAGDDSASVSVMGKWTNRDFLLALNKENGEIKFISGQFFISAIADDFTFNKYDPASYLNFLKLKLFPFQVDNITYVKRRHKKLYFYGASSALNKSLYIVLSLKDLEHPLVNVSQHTTPALISHSTRSGATAGRE